MVRLADRPCCGCLIRAWCLRCQNRTTYSTGDVRANWRDSRITAAGFDQSSDPQRGFLNWRRSVSKGRDHKCERVFCSFSTSSRVEILWKRKFLTLATTDAFCGIYQGPIVLRVNDLFQAFSWRGMEIALNPYRCCCSPPEH
jgi:hypothetical protein